MSAQMREALQRLTAATDKLLDDMRERAIMRGDFDTEDGRKIAILDCGNGVLFDLDAARDMATAALAVPDKPPSDADRLNWLEARQASLVTHREPMDDGATYGIWWTVVDNVKRISAASMSGHPLGSVRDAIDAAIKAKGKQYV